METHTSKAFTEFIEQLVSLGVRLSFENDKAAIRSALIFGPIYNLYVWLRRLREPPKDVIALVRDYAETRHVELTFQSSPAGWVWVGWRLNPNLKEEMEAYNRQKPEYKRLKALHEEQIEKLKISYLGLADTHIKNEIAREECSFCRGAGYVPSMSEHPDQTCSSCNGTGGSGYTAQISEQQKTDALEFEQRLKQLERTPPILRAPEKELMTYASAARKDIGV